MWHNYPQPQQPVWNLPAVLEVIPRCATEVSRPQINGLEGHRFYLSLVTGGNLTGASGALLTGSRPANQQGLSRQPIEQTERASIGLAVAIAPVEKTVSSVWTRQVSFTDVCH